MEKGRRNMQKLEKQKHSHKFTNILKGIIFAIVMLAPFLAVAVRCLYVTNNDNANQSYSGANGYSINYKYETNEVNTLADLKVGNIYKFTVSEQYSSIVELVDATAIYGFEVYSYSYNTTAESLNTNVLHVRTNTGGIVVANSAYSSFLSVSYNQITLPFSFYVVYSNLHPQSIATADMFSASDYNIIEDVDITNEGTLDNVFEYSINQLNEMPIFNWVKNTGIYTPISNMTNGLGFDNNNNQLALLLAYWSLNTAIYIVFDIIIWCFTKLTHFMIDTD